jgi:hypothetical protein
MFHCLIQHVHNSGFNNFYSHFGPINCNIFGTYTSFTLTPPPLRANSESNVQTSIAKVVSLKEFFFLVHFLSPPLMIFIGTSNYDVREVYDYGIFFYGLTD